MGSLDSLIRSKRKDWAQYYDLIETQFGATVTLLDILGVNHDPKATTFVGKKYNASGLAPTWTPSSALSAWATPPNLLDESGYLGLAPVLTFDGTGNEMDSPDAGFWTRADAAFSVWAWVNLTDATSSSILTKHTVDQLEWRFFYGSDDKLALEIIDEATGGNPTISVKADNAQAEKVWVFVMATVNGGTDESGMNLYVNGATIAQTQADSGTFNIMVGGTAVVGLGVHNTNQDLFSGKMLGGPWSPGFVQAELTAEQVANYYEGMRLGLGV